MVRQTREEQSRDANRFNPWPRCRVYRRSRPYPTPGSRLILEARFRRRPPMKLSRGTLHAAGFLPVVIQETAEPTRGRSSGRFMRLHAHLAISRSSSSSRTTTPYFVATTAGQLPRAADVMALCASPSPDLLRPVLASMTRSSTNGRSAASGAHRERVERNIAGAAIDQEPPANSHPAFTTRTQPAAKVSTHAGRRLHCAKQSGSSSSQA